MKRRWEQRWVRRGASELRRALVCGALLGAMIAAFRLWRVPLPGRGLDFAMGVLSTLVGVLGVWTGLRPAEPDSRDVPASFLAYDRYRFLWLAIGCSALALGAFLFDAPPGGRSGGSWLGYTLGSLCFAAMLWLMWFGVRKRSYASRGAPLRAWLSAHAYLGLALLVVMPLHSAFEFGWNVHTLSMALAALTIATGIAGLGVYGRVPRLMTLNRPGQKLNGLLEQIADLDARCRKVAASLPDDYARVIEDSILNTRIGGGLVAQLSSRGVENVRTAIDAIERGGPLPLEVEDHRIQSIEMLNVKERLLRRIARDLHYKALLDVWLLLHVPLAFAAVLAVGIHVFVVFYYR